MRFSTPCSELANRQRFMDNFEWNSGLVPRFGSVYVDFETFERRPKKSAYFVTEVGHSVHKHIETSSRAVFSQEHHYNLTSCAERGLVKLPNLWLHCAPC